MTGTGDPDPATAARMSPAALEPPPPTTTTAWGRPSSTTRSIASAVTSDPAARMLAPALAVIGSSCRVSAAMRASTSSSSASSRSIGSRARLVEQHYRNAVTNWELESALGAHQNIAALFDRRVVVFRTSKDFNWFRVKRAMGVTYASGMRNLTNCLNHGEHIVTNLFHLLRVRCLNIEAQQRFGVGRAKVEPPVLCFDCHSVKGVDRDAWLPLELGPNRSY